MSLQEKVDELSRYYKGVDRHIIEQCVLMTAAIENVTVDSVYKCIKKNVYGSLGHSRELGVDETEMSSIWKDLPSDPVFEIFSQLDPINFIKVCEINVEYARRCNMPEFWISYLMGRSLKDWLFIFDSIRVKRQERLFNPLLRKFIEEKAQTESNFMKLLRDARVQENDDMYHAMASTFEKKFSQRKHKYTHRFGDVHTLHVKNDGYNVKYSQETDYSIHISIPGFRYTIPAGKITLPNEIMEEFMSRDWDVSALEILEKRIFLPRVWEKFESIKSRVEDSESEKDEDSDDSDDSEDD
jgi:hypothetical protein